MAATLAHRGPDGCGVWTSDAASIALGHRRLAVIDTTTLGSQPMSSANSQYVITFNGEIYNHLEIRSELLADGIRFRGDSDTETLIEAIACWGIERALAKANGMFAFALWDKSAHLLRLVRDRLGQKPLYYGWAGDALAFASELKALRAHADFTPKISSDALAAFLRHGHVPAPHTIYQDVYKLPAGTVLSIGSEVLLNRSLPLPSPYWSATETAQAGTAGLLDGSDGDITEKLHALLADAVRCCMVADVPIGAFLSGGIDSSVIVSLMQAQSPNPVRTFSIGFAEHGYNEADDAAEIARHLGTSHTSMCVTSADAQATIPQLPEIYDEPFADSSQIPTFLVSRLARDKVTVSLSGDGADELFGGYNRYGWAARVNKLFHLAPPATRRLASWAMTSIPPSRWDTLNRLPAFALPKRLRYRQLGDKLHKLAGVIDAPDRETMYQRLVSQWACPSKITRRVGEAPTVVSDPAQWPALPSFAQQMMLLDTLVYLPDDILVKLDRAAMAVSLEGRVPYLDHRVVEFAWRLPHRFKLRSGSTKWVLREILARYLPRHLFARPKMGFGVPIGDWLRSDLREWAESLLAPQRLKQSGYLDAATLASVWNEHLSGIRNWQHQLWTVLMFEAWREHVRVG